jgi:fumarate hydratase subunit beta
MKVKTPVTDEVARKLRVGEHIEVHGKIFTGRDAVLPTLRCMIEKGMSSKLISKLDGSVIMHAGFSSAGFGPTTSNKKAIEESIASLASVGVKIHIGKGSLSEQTVKALELFDSVFAVTPPVTALFMEKLKATRIIAFEDEGMEAMHELEVEGLPAIVAIAHGKSIYGRKNRLHKS